MARVIEESLYSEIERIFREHGAEEVVRVKGEKEGTTPDFTVKWLGEKWIVSIKIGDPITDSSLLVNAFKQYVRHMVDFNLKYGMIIFYPKNIRKIKPTDEEIRNAVRNTPAYFIVLNPQTEIHKTLSDGLDEIEKILKEKIRVAFRPETVIGILRKHIEDLMKDLKLEQSQILKIVNPDLFFGINPVEKDEKKREKVLENASKFLSAYIFLTQVLFLRYYCEERPAFIEDVEIENIGREEAKRLFDKIRGINYRPIFDIDVIDMIPEDMISETFKLLFSIQIEDRLRYDLPGRLFHELMPEKIRKLLAAFYTRPSSAYLLTLLTIDKPENTVFDPACGSGTILTMAYRRKLELWSERKKERENPHKLFCEEQISGCDIMPFAVHLTNANLVAMNPLTTIDLTSIVLGDSLKLAPCEKVKPGFVTLSYFIDEHDGREGREGHDGQKEIKKIKGKAFNRFGDVIEITLNPVDVVLMNPPFTKIERGIKKYIDTSKFEDVVGGEVGLWGHFVALADAFLKDGGVFGAILPINLLRGRESERVREIIFRKWTPLYIIKPSMNYGFSEHAEYRDILVIARKQQKPDHKVKFCIIKKDLNKLSDDEIRWIAEIIKRVEKLRSEVLDVDSHPLDALNDNMMHFISGYSLEMKDALLKIIEEAEKIFCPFPPKYFREGYMPKPKGVSKFMFITRRISESRTDEAFLVLENESDDKIEAKTPVGVKKFEFGREHFLPCFRTPVGLNRMDITNMHDYVCNQEYENMDKVMELCGFQGNLSEDYWNYVGKEFERAKSRVAVVRRINPFSPNQMLTAFYSDKHNIFANTFNVVHEKRKDHAKAVTVLLNSVFFLSYFFNSKEESTGRYIDVRFYDLYGMRIYPSDEQVERLVRIFEKYRKEEFPALREQLDMHFDERYEWFWAQERGKETPEAPPPVEPHPMRLKFDLDVINTLNANLTEEDILKAYEVIVQDMIITRGLKRD